MLHISETSRTLRYFRDGSKADIATTPRDIRFAPKSGVGQVRMASRSEARKFLSRLMCHSRLMASLRVLQHSE